jgi:hypothetical protein
LHPRDTRVQPLTGFHVASHHSIVVFLAIARTYVVTQHKSSGPVGAVELRQGGPTPTCALDHRIGVSLCPTARIPLAIGYAVFSNGPDNLEVFRPVVRLVAVTVVYLLARSQPAPQQLLGHKPMFVRIAANIGKAMVRPDAD